METILGVLLGISFIGLLGGIPSGIVVGVIAKRENDENRKKKLKRISLWLFLAPFLLLIVAGLARGFAHAV